MVVSMTRKISPSLGPALVRRLTLTVAGACATVARVRHVD
jgi:hypothetical protein